MGGQMPRIEERVASIEATLVMLQPAIMNLSRETSTLTKEIHQYREDMITVGSRAESNTHRIDGIEQGRDKVNERTTDRWFKIMTVALGAILGFGQAFLLWQLTHS